MYVCMYVCIYIYIYRERETCSSRSTNSARTKSRRSTNSCRYRRACTLTNTVQYLQNTQGCRAALSIRLDPKTKRSVHPHRTDQNYLHITNQISPQNKSNTPTQNKSKPPKRDAGRGTWPTPAGTAVGVWGVVLGVLDSGFGVKGLGFRVSDLGFRV